MDAESIKVTLWKMRIYHTDQKPDPNLGVRVHEHLRRHFCHIDTPFEDYVVEGHRGQDCLQRAVLSAPFHHGWDPQCRKLTAHHGPFEAQDDVGVLIFYFGPIKSVLCDDGESRGTLLTRHHPEWRYGQKKITETTLPLLLRAGESITINGHTLTCDARGEIRVTANHPA